MSLIKKIFGEDEAKAIEALREAQIDLYFQIARAKREIERAELLARTIEASVNLEEQ